MDKVGTIVSINAMPMLETMCLMPQTNFFVQMTFQTMGPILLALSIGAYYLVKRTFYPTDPQQSDELKQRCASAFLALTYVVFAGSSLVSLRSFSCDSEFDIDEKYGKDASYLKYDYSIDCNAREYLWGWRLYSLAMVVVYPVSPHERLR